jgi:hypothetical protein
MEGTYRSLFGNVQSEFGSLPAPDSIKPRRRAPDLSVAEACKVSGYSSAA